MSNIWKNNNLLLKESKISVLDKYDLNTITEILNFLLDKNVIQRESIDFSLLSSIYDTNSIYPNSSIFKITSPRYFGENWGQVHLQNKFPMLKSPSKSLDSKYLPQQYDLYYKGIRIEVKSSRAVDKSSKGTGSLLDRGLCFEDKDSSKFLMNFQQIKPFCCDVFIFIGVWLDDIKYFIIPSNEIKLLPDFRGKQHRTSTDEGQLAITNKNIDYYLKNFSVDVDFICKKLDSYL